MMMISKIIIKEISDPDVDLPGELKEWAVGMNK